MAKNKEKKAGKRIYVLYLQRFIKKRLDNGTSVGQAKH